jgi:predicted ester cyclase
VGKQKQENDMTSKLDVVRAWTDMPAGNIEESADYLSDDFQNVDADGNVIVDKAGWIGMGQMMYSSLPDIKYVRTGLREEGDFVIMTGHFEGTFTNDLDLSAMGAGVIPANGKRIVWPETSGKFIVEGSKIVREEPYGESGGMEAFLAPLMG